LRFVDDKSIFSLPIINEPGRTVLASTFIDILFNFKPQVSNKLVFVPFLTVEFIYLANFSD